jgi:cytochrome c-type biogenesis protein
VSTALLTLAFVAGAVAAFNPCGFALLPAHLSLRFASPDETAGGAGQLAAISRAGRFTAGMTLGFVAAFGLLAWRRRPWPWLCSGTSRSSP